MHKAMKIDVWSDIACPWCYIGKRRLEAALDEFGAAEGVPTFEVEYHSFELAPETPVDFDGSEVDFLVSHKGMTALRVKEMLGLVKSVARDVGLDYDFESLQHTSTVKAHQLLHFAKERGKQLEMKERLLRAYFVEGRHVGRDDELADLAAEIGLEREAVLAALRASHHLADVRADQQRARAWHHVRTVLRGRRPLRHLWRAADGGLRGCADACHQRTPSSGRIMSATMDADLPGEASPRATPPTLEMLGEQEVAVCHGDACSMPEKDFSSDTTNNESIDLVSPKR